MYNCGLFPPINKMKQNLLRQKFFIFWSDVLNLQFQEIKKNIYKIHYNLCVILIVFLSSQQFFISKRFAIKLIKRNDKQHEEMLDNKVDKKN